MLCFSLQDLFVCWKVVCSYVSGLKFVSCVVHFWWFVDDLFSVSMIWQIVGISNFFSSN